MTAGAAAASSDLVYAMHRLTWTWSVQRGGYFAQDRILRAILADERLRRVVVADHFRSAVSLAARTALRREEPFPESDRHHHLRPLRLRRLDPTEPEAARRTYVRYARVLARAARRHGMDRPAVMTTNPLLAGLGDLGWASRVTYYGTDDFGAGEEDRPVQGVYELAYAGIRAAGHDVAVVSRHLLDRIAPTGTGIVVPNGIDPGEWDVLGTPPGWFADLPRPRLLYLGSIDRRIDVEEVARVARAVPDGSVALVGIPVDAERVAFCERLPNVVVHPRVDRATVAAIAGAADAGLVPHHVTRATTAMSPLKVYEYLAAGLPVAATALAELRGLDDRVVVASDERGFEQAVLDAVALGRADEPTRRRFIAANSWASRHKALLDLAMGGAADGAAGRA